MESICSICWNKFTVAVYETGVANYSQVVIDTATNKAVVAFRDQGDSNKGKFNVGTISGTDVSFGSETELVDRYHGDGNLVYDPDLAKLVFTSWMFNSGNSARESMVARYIKIDGTTPSLFKTSVFPIFFLADVIIVSGIFFQWLFFMQVSYSWIDLINLGFFNPSDLVNILIK